MGSIRPGNTPHFQQADQMLQGKTVVSEPCECGHFIEAKTVAVQRAVLWGALSSVLSDLLE